ncbi:MAG: hypothetical protein AAFX06_04250 [Planctomycetota bacterium]
MSILDGMPFDPDATHRYEHLSGGFIWCDEFPQLHTPDWRIVSHDYLYRYLIQFRRRLTLGIAHVDEFPLWQQVASSAPNWPGLDAERRSQRVAQLLKAAERDARDCYKKLGQ